MGYSRVTAKDIQEALEVHHQPNNGWTVLHEVWGIDTLAIHAWRSTKHRRIAYEIKTSRSDFRSELKVWPHKAATAIDMSHGYYFAVPKGLLYPEEIASCVPWPDETRAPKRSLWLPPGVGLVEVTKQGVRRTKVAKYRKDTRAWTDQEIAHLARYAHRPDVIRSAWLDRQKMLAEKYEAKREKEEAQKAQERTLAILERHGTDILQPGQRWLVSWFTAPAIAGQRIGGMVEVTVARIEDGHAVLTREGVEEERRVLAARMILEGEVVDPASTG